MTPSARDLFEAKEATAALLEALDLKNYLFEVEVADEQWAIHLECDSGTNWQTAVIPVDHERLLASRESNAERQALLRAWRQHLSG